MERNAAEMVCASNCAFGSKMTNELKAELWFQKFRCWNKKHKKSRGRDSVM